MKPSILPRKSLGQHFLIDVNIARKIVSLAAVTPTDYIVEIGPGQGMLTAILLAQGARVLAIEIDPRLYKLLGETFTNAPNLEPVRADACFYPYHNIVEPFRVIANLPYNIATLILFRLLAETDRLTDMVLMVQKEVADRLAAPCGSKTYGALSVLFQALADVTVLLTVPPTCFRPRPKIYSTVIHVMPNPTKIDLVNPPLFKKVVKGAFSHRRKHLMNAFIDAGFPRDLLFEVFKKTGIAPTCRAETQTVQAFASLANSLCHISADPLCIQKPNA